MLIAVIVHSAPPEDLNHLVPIYREAKKRLRGVSMTLLDRVATATIDQTEVFRPSRSMDSGRLRSLRSLETLA